MLKETVVAIPANKDGESIQKNRFEHTLSPLFPAIAVASDGTIRHLTVPAKVLLGYRHEQFVSSSFFSLIHGRNLQQVMRDVADMVTHGKSQASWFLRMRTGKNNWQWFRAVAQNHLETPESVITIILRGFQEM